MAACYGGAIFAREYHPIVNVAFALIGVAWAAINVNSYPMIVAMSSGSDVGKFTGTYYTFSMAAQILTPVLSGFLLENVSLCPFLLPDGIPYYDPGTSRRCEAPEKREYSGKL